MKEIKDLGKSLLMPVDFSAIMNQGIGRKELHAFIPPYMYLADRYEASFFSYFLVKIIPKILGLFFKLIVNPRKGKVGDLGPDEVEFVYKREAGTYNWKHHFTTRGMDLIWRRKAAYTVINYALKHNRKIMVLDLCTGTGLTVREMEKLGRLWPVQLRIIGIDYCEKILSQTDDVKKYCQQCEVEFTRADATNLIKNNIDEFACFEPGSIDIITQMFGIGGIDQPLKVFNEVLRLLKPGGQYCLIDMHKPIKEQSGEWPMLFKWFRLPNFEMMCYERVCIPLALKLLWGWRDTTPVFYLVRLIVEKDLEINKWYGFKVIYFEYDPQRWWLALPVMPNAKILLEKEEISEAEAKKRQNILNACI